MEKKLILVKPKGIRMGVFYSQMILLGDEVGRRYPNLQILYFVENKKYFTREHSFISRITRRVVTSGDILYLRSPLDYVKYRFLLFGRGVRFIYDFRALVFVESWFRNKSLIRAIVIFLLEWFAYLTSHQVSAVTNKLSKKAKCWFLIPRDILVVPTLVKSDKILPIKVKSDILKLVYLGGMSKWQCFNEIVLIVKKLQEIATIDFDVLTNEKTLAEEVCDKSGVRYRVRTIEPENIAYELAKYDFGFLIREDITLNHVAAPIKFLEYLASNVIPIMSPNIGDYSELAYKNNIGLILQDLSLDPNMLLEKLWRMRSDSGVYTRIEETLKSYSWHSKNHTLVTSKILG